MKIDRTAWYIAAELGVRGRPPQLVTDLRIVGTSGTASLEFEALDPATDLIQATKTERLGAVFMREITGFARRAPPAWFTTGGLVSVTTKRLRVRYLTGFRDPGGATGLVVRPVTRETMSAIPDAPTFRTDAEFNAWLDTLGAP